MVQPAQPDLTVADPAILTIARQERTWEACKEQGLDALMVRDTSNIHWLTAFENVFDDEQAHALVIAENGAILHTDSRYANAAVAAAQLSAGTVEVDDARETHAAFARRVLVPEGEQPQGLLGFEDSITYAEYGKLVETFGDKACLKPTNGLVLWMRAVKDVFEIERLCAAQAITDAAFSHITGFMRPGMTEREVQIELEDFMLRHGAESLAFRSIVAAGPHGADPHAVPSDARLEAGQCVVMDFGAKAYGYCSDMTRMVFLGEPDDELRRAYDVLREANERVEAMLRPGVTGKEAHELAEQVLADGGFAGKMGHGLGHGVGLDIHEEPCLNTRNDKPLEIGNVVTVEPGIYMPGRFGMRLEDCGVITEDGFTAFTSLGHEMTVI